MAVPPDVEAELGERFAAAALAQLRHDDAENSWLEGYDLEGFASLIGSYLAQGNTESQIMDDLDDFNGSGPDSQSFSKEKRRFVRLMLDFAPTVRNGKPTPPPSILAHEQDRQKPLEGSEISSEPEQTCTCCQDKLWVEPEFCDKAKRSDDPNDPCSACRWYGGNSLCKLSYKSDRQALRTTVKTRPIMDPRPPQRYAVVRTNTDRKAQRPARLMDRAKPDSDLKPDWQGAPPPAPRPFSDELKKNPKKFLQGFDYVPKTSNAPSAIAYQKRIAERPSEPAGFETHPDISQSTPSCAYPSSAQALWGDGADLLLRNQGDTMILPPGGKVTVTYENTSDEPMAVYTQPTQISRKRSRDDSQTSMMSSIRPSCAPTQGSRPGSQHSLPPARHRDTAPMAEPTRPDPMPRGGNDTMIRSLPPLPSDKESDWNAQGLQGHTGKANGRKRQRLEAPAGEETAHQRHNSESPSGEESPPNRQLSQPRDTIELSEKRN